MRSKPKDTLDDLAKEVRQASRRFGGLNFYTVIGTDTKSNAKRIAGIMRKSGHHARIRYEPGEVYKHRIYIREK